MNITLPVLTKLFPATKSSLLTEVLPAIQKTATQYQINTVGRAAAFLAQVGHESGGFNFREENLNYSQQGLLKVFPKYFPTAGLAAQYAHNKQAIANRVYANRMGNGSEQSGDGFKFRGKGYIQITGRFNTMKFADSLQMDEDAAIAYLLTVEGAAVSAGWFWSNASLNALADHGDILTITKRINGGTLGLNERTALFNKAQQYLALA
jgi:putative chitinase